MGHHGEQYMKCFLTSYDQYHNRKYKSGPREWDRHRIKWEPETVDHPADGKIIQSKLL